MKDIKHSIDWLNYSIDWPSSVMEWPLNNEAEELSIIRSCIPYRHVTGLPPARSKANSAQGMHGYTKFFDMLWAVVGVHPNFKSQKIGVRMTGGDCQAYRDLGGSDCKMVEFVNHANAMTSRVDIAFDLFDYGINVPRLYDDWKSGKLKCRARTARPLTEGVMVDGVVTEATTVYFGSRESELMARVYEKGKQTATGLDWTRFEVEIKGDRAIRTMKDCERFGVDVVGKQVLREYFPVMPYRFWKSLTAGPSTALTGGERKKTERQIWLENIVFPMLRDEISSEWDSGQFTGITEALEGIIRGNWQRRAIEIKKSFGRL